MTPYRLLVATAVAAGLLAAAPAAWAQSAAPDFPTSPAPAAAPRRAARATAQEMAREQSRAQMSPEEAKRDQQMALLEARTGNTTFSRNGPERQLDKATAGGGFTVRKFKGRVGQPGNDRRGQGHYMGGIDPPGKPLEHKHPGKKKFGIF